MTTKVINRGVVLEGPSGRGGTESRSNEEKRYIHDLIDASQGFFVSGWPGVAAGLITTVGAILTAFFMSRPGKWEMSPTLWAVWVVFIASFLASDMIFFVNHSREAHRPVFSVLLLKTAAIEILMTAMGLILSLLFIKTATPEYIPGAWLLALGFTLASLGFFLPGGSWVLGLVLFIASIAAFIVPTGGLWCVGFAGMAMCLWGAAHLVTRSSKCERYM